MKRLISTFLLPLLLICGGCTLDDPLNPYGQGNESYTDDPVDPVNPDTSIEDPFELEDEEDAVANTSFDRTISIAFSAAGATVTGGGMGGPGQGGPGGGPGFF